MSHKKKSISNKVGAVMLVRKDGAALMQHRDVKPGLRRSGMWVPPGGHAEPDENIKTCARRELLEETAYDCSNLQFLIEFEDYVKGWPSYLLTVFWAYYDGIQQLQCLEGQDLKFINRDQADSYDIPKYLLNVWDMALTTSKKNRLQ
jgi:8-oxo-dGTP pyrophosphatase MutT (NUDIX family)